MASEKSGLSIVGAAARLLGSSKRIIINLKQLYLTVSEKADPGHRCD
jgi:hypothetical protein